MQTRILDSSSLSKAADLIRRGRLVAFPTETVYGLGARIFCPEAIAAIFEIKGRPSDNPLIVHVHSLAQVEMLARDIPPAFYQLVQAFWPGPLTCVLSCHPDVPVSVSRGLKSIAVRMPSHPLALELLRLVDEPLVAPSANVSGRPSPTSARHVMEDFSGKIAAVVDGGDTEWGIESTVVSLLEKQAVLLRPGSITLQALEKELGVSIEVMTHAKDGVVLSPGMKYRHYAPRAPIKMVKTREELACLVNGSRGRKMVLASFDLRCVFSEMETHILSAKTLYSLLRRADREGVEEIIILCDFPIQSDAALMNRLTKAAGLDYPPDKL